MTNLPTAGWMESPDQIVVKVTEGDPDEVPIIIQDIRSYACKEPPAGDPGSPVPPTTTSQAQEPDRSKHEKPSQNLTKPPGLEARRFYEVLPQIEVLNKTLQDVAEKTNGRSDILEKMVKSISDELQHMSEALKSVHQQALHLQTDNEKLARENVELRQTMSETEVLLSKQDTFSRGFHLRLHGVAEDSSEDVGEKVREVCKEVVPEEEKDRVAAEVDGAHRQGLLKAGGDPRPIIIRFTSRASRDLTWKHAEQSDFLLSHGFRFEEDLGDEAVGSCVWLEEEMAREEDFPKQTTGVEGVPSDLEGNFSLELQEPEPSQIQQEQDELCSFQESGQFSPHQESDPFTATPAGKPELSIYLNLSQSSPAADVMDQENGKCKVCGEVCSDDDAWLVHMKGHVSEKQFLCFICEERFQTLILLSKHIKIHTGEYPYVCDVCEIGFSANQKLKFHVRIHTGERPFSCHICGKTFVRKLNMKSHLKTHSRHRYLCKICGKTFKRTGGLDNHMKSHTGEKFSCHICGKTFLYRDSMTRHLKFHSRDTSCSCKICDRTIKSAIGLVSHMRTHKVGKPYICGTSFAKKSALSHHTDEHRNKSSDPSKTPGETVHNANHNES